MVNSGDKIGFNKVREYLEEKKSGILEEISAITYVTKPRAARGGIDSRVVAWSDPQSHIAEQYRSIRTNITSLFMESQIKAFLLTSALRGEGKSISSANLATVFAGEMDKKVVLIDGDMRKPTLHRVFSREKSPGLSGVLAGRVSPEKSLLPSMIDNLKIILSGEPPANPSELLGSERMKELLEYLRERFDYIIFDVAPILAVTDAGVLGLLLDGSVIVVRAGKTQAVDVERAYSLLLEANANPIGSILAGVVTYIPYYLYRYRYMYSHNYYST